MERLLAALYDLIHDYFAKDDRLPGEPHFNDSPSDRKCRRSCQFGCLVLLLLGILMAVLLLNP